MIDLSVKNSDDRGRGKFYPPATKCAHDLAGGTGFVPAFDTYPDLEGPTSPVSFDCGKRSSCSAGLLRFSVGFMSVFAERTFKCSLFCDGNGLRNG